MSVFPLVAPAAAAAAATTSATSAVVNDAPSLISLAAVYLLEEKLNKMIGVLEEITVTFNISLKVDGWELLLEYEPALQLMRATIAALDVSIVSHGITLESTIKRLISALRNCKRRRGYVFAVSDQEFSGTWIAINEYLIGVKRKLIVAQREAALKKEKKIK